MLRYN